MFIAIGPPFLIRLLTIGNLFLVHIHSFSTNLSMIASKEATTFMRNRMVEQQLIRRGILNQHVLNSMRQVERHQFVPPNHVAHAYDDRPLPIGNDQTISQPYIVAYMAEAAAITKTDKVLEIGTGCGYNAAVLSNLAEKVYTVETIKQLADAAHARLNELGYRNIQCIHGDGSVGYPTQAPYDVIIVTAGAPQVPPSLLNQLAVHGRMIIPVSRGIFAEELLKIIRSDGSNYSEEYLCPVGFVPLVGQEGWN
jgi:protein-L-isoaspartate(D-aspartate) O-methyltransferase